MDVKLFTCYSTNLRDFISNKGIKSKITGLHPKTKCQFWVYIEDEVLDKCLKEWKLRPTIK